MFWVSKNHISIKKWDKIFIFPYYPRTTHSTPVCKVLKTGDEQQRENAKKKTRQGLSVEIVTWETFSPQFFSLVFILWLFFYLSACHFFVLFESEWVSSDVMLKIGRKTLLMFCLLWDWKDSPCCEEYPSSLVEKKRGVRERWVTSKNMNIYDITYILFSCLISPVQVWVINQKIYDLLTLLKHVAICLINILWVKREQLCISGEVGHLRCGPRRQTNWKVNRETCAQYSNFWKSFFCQML